ncbi:MAG: hypothetical protein MCM46_12810 [Candidatus Manganitrophus sp. SB1]|nr:hypothetical protein [Candidatus Manganitrophus morganii]
MKRFIPIVLFFLISLSGCGNYNPISIVQFVATGSKSDSGNSDSSSGSSGSGGGAPVIPGRSLKALSIKPENPSVPLGRHLLFSAVGTYSDGTTEDVTQLVIWNADSSQPVADFLSEPIAARPGVLRSSGIGTSTITAFYQGVVASTLLIVTEPEVERIDITLPNSKIQIAVGAKFQVFASGWYTNQENRPITDSILCSVADTRIATITSTPEVNCIIFGLTPGATVLTVLADHATLEIILEVLPIQTLDALDEEGIGGSMIGIDEAGNILVVWRRWPSEPGQFRSSRYDVSNSVWSDSGLVDTDQGSIDDLKFAMNKAGQALLVWSGPQGVFSSVYLPGSGWQEKKTVTVDSNGTLVDVKVDPDGKGVVAWLNSSGIFITEQISGSGWSTPSNRGSAVSASLAMNSEGDAILVRRDSSLYASFFKKGLGWQPEVVLSNSLSNQSHRVAMDTFGGIVVWTEDSGIKAARYEQTTGWKLSEALSGATPGGFLPFALAVSPGGHVIVMWRDHGNSTLVYSLFHPGLGWQTPETLGFGFEPFQVRMDKDGNVLATWTFGQTIGISRYRQTTGWEENELLPSLRGYTLGPALEMNASGTAAVIWPQGVDLYLYRFHFDRDNP